MSEQEEAITSVIVKKEDSPALVTSTSASYPATIEETVSTEIIKLIPTAGTLELIDEQRNILYEPVHDEDIEIRPDGQIYLPWVEYADRLDRAFGGGGWTMVEHGSPRLEGNIVIWGFHLIIKGRYCGIAYGGQEYHPNNPTMNWADAIEGAKSNALMRLCKGIGVSKELWRPSFIKKYKEKYAESYQGQDRYGNTKTLWRKKADHKEPTEPEGDIPNPFEQKPKPPLMVSLIWIDGKKRKVTVTEAMEAFESMKSDKYLGEKPYRDILGGCGYENKGSLAHNPKELERVWNELVKEWNESIKRKQVK
jgi:hypothetical protein